MPKKQMSEDAKKEISRLNKLREKVGISIEDLSKMLQIAHTTVYRIFALKTDTSLTNYLKIKKELEK